MPTPSELELGGRVALILAQSYMKASPTLSMLDGVLAAVSEYNRETGKGPDHKPTSEELQAFIAHRKNRRIEIPEDFAPGTSDPSVGGSG